MKLFHLYLEGGPAPPMTSSICVFHLGISLGMNPSHDKAMLSMVSEPFSYRLTTTDLLGIEPNAASICSKAHSEASTNQPSPTSSSGKPSPKSIGRPSIHQILSAMTRPWSFTHRNMPPSAIDQPSRKATAGFSASQSPPGESAQHAVWLSTNAEISASTCNEGYSDASFLTTPMNMASGSFASCRCVRFPVSNTL